MSKCIAAPARLLSEVGLEASETIRLSKDLPTRKSIFDNIEAFLDGIAQGKFPNPRILWLVGEWGEGKTAVYRGLIEPRDDIISFYIVSSKIFDYIKYYNRLLSGKRIWRPYIFLASVIHALVDNIDDEKIKTSILTKIHSENFEEGLHMSLIILRKYLDNKYGKHKPLLLFLDEFEDIVTKSESEENKFLFHIIFESLVEIVNNIIDILKKTFGNKFNLAIAVTRNAEYVIETHTTIANIWGRLKRRILRIEMKPLLQIETIELARRLINYIWEEPDLKLSFDHIAEPPCLMNFLAFSSMGLPASVEHIINHLVSVLLVRGKENCNNQLEKLTLDNAIDVLRGLKTVVYGSEQEVFMYENYIVERNNYMNSLKEIVGDKPYLRQIIDQILLSITGLDLEKDLYEVIKSNIDIEAIVSFLEYHGIGYKAKKYKILSNSLDKFINEYVIRLSKEILDQNEVYYRNLVRIFGEETLKSLIDLYSELLDRLVYISSSSRIILVIPEKLEKFYEKYLNIEPAQSIYVARFIKQLIEKLVNNGVIEEDGETILLSPQVITKIFFSQEIAVLDFIDRKEIRPAIWKEARSTRSGEPFLIGALVPILDILKGYFSGFKKLDREELVIKSGQSEPLPYAEVKVTAYNERGQPKKYKITVLGTEYVPILKVHVVPITGKIEPDALTRYVEKLKETSPIDRPHIVIFLQAGILSSSSLNEIKESLKSLNIAMLSVPFKVIDYFKLTALGLYHKNLIENLRDRDIKSKEDYVLKLVELVEGKIKLEGINDFVLKAYIRSQLETTDALRNLINNIDEELLRLGILIPHPRRSLKINNIEVGTPDLYKAASSLKWIIHYDKPLRTVPIEDIFKHILNKVQRYTIFDRRYPLVIGLDIENPDTLARYLGPLMDLKIIKLEYPKSKSNIVKPSQLLLTLTLDESNFFRRLYSIINNVQQGPKPSDILNTFVVKESPDETLDVFFMALKALGIMHIEHSKHNMKTIRLQTNSEALDEKCQYLTNYIEKYKEKMENEEELYGYIVSGKKRHQPPWNPGYRYGKTSELRHYIEDKLGKICQEVTYANNDLPMSIDLSRRIASVHRILIEILGGPHIKRNEKKKSKEGLKTHYEIIIESEKEVNFIKNNILMKSKDELEEKIESLKKLLVERLFANNVIINASLINTINESIKKIDDIINIVYDEETLGELVSNLWKQYSGDEFPFNCKGKGKGYLFNYKIYEIVENVLRRISILDIDLTKTRSSGKYRFNDEYLDLLDKLEELNKRIKKDLELIANLGKEYNYMKSKILESPLLVKLFGKDIISKMLPENIVALVKLTPERNIYDLTSTEDLALLESEIEKWESKILGERQNVDRLYNKLRTLESLLESMDRQYSHLSTVVYDLGKNHRLLSELINDLSNLVEHNVIDRDKLKKLEEKLSSLRSSEEFKKIIDEIREICLKKAEVLSLEARLNLDQIVSLFKCINNELSERTEKYDKLLEEIRDLIRDIAGEIHRFYGTRYEQFENIYSLVNKLFEKTQHNEQARTRLEGLMEEINEIMNTINDVRKELKTIIHFRAGSGQSYEITEQVNILKECVKATLELIYKDPSKFKVELLDILMKTGLSEEELKVLKAVIEHYSAKVSERISIRELIRICSEKYGISREDVMKGLFGLVEKDIISAEIIF